MNGEVGNGLDGPNKGLLTYILLGVIGTRLNERGKVADFVYLEVWWQGLAAKLSEIQPFVGSILQTTIIEIKPINVDVGPSHEWGSATQFLRLLRKCRSRPEAALRPASEPTGVVGLIISHKSILVHL